MNDTPEFSSLKQSLLKISIIIIYIIQAVPQMKKA